MPRPCDMAAIGGHTTGKQSQKRGFSAAVIADQPQTITRIDREVQSTKQQASSRAVGQAVGM